MNPGMVQYMTLGEEKEGREMSIEEDAIFEADSESEKK